MAMSEPLSGLSLTSPPPPPQLATPASSSTDDGVDMSAGDDEEDIIKNFGATSRYAGKLSSCVPKLVISHGNACDIRDSKPIQAMGT